MTSKERMLIAMQNGRPDRVPCAPDISTMIPTRLTGKPSWEVEMRQDPPLWKAYMEAARYFGIDAWFIYGALDFTTSSSVYSRARTVEHEDRIVMELCHFTPNGELHSEVTFFRDNPAATNVKMMKSIVDDFPKIRHFYTDLTDYDSTTFEEMRRSVGDDGAFGASVSYPGLHHWIIYAELEELTYAYVDYPEIFDEWRELEDRRATQIMEMTLDARPDFVLLGGSGSITMQSPAIFRRLALPTIEKLTRMAKEAGVPTMLHSCGKERALVEMVATETDLNCVNPLEVPPMGDCELAEIKRSFGDRIAMMGNLHTTDVMLNGTPDIVERAAMKAIDDAGKDGGFILSTGDQCGRDTPEENIRKLVEVCKSYGVY